MAQALLEKLARIVRRRRGIKNAILQVYELHEFARVRRFEVASECAKILDIYPVSPQFQADVCMVAVSLGARAVVRANARFFVNLRRRANPGNG